MILVLGIIAVNTTGLKSEVEDSENINISDIEDLISTFCDGVSYYDIEELSYDEIETIDVEIPQSQNWYENLYQAYIHSKDPIGNYINEMFKSNFNAIIKIKYSNNIDCSFKGTVRINGDLPDHLI